MFMNSVIDLTACLPEQPAPRRRKRKFGSIAAAVETAVTLLMGVGFLLALTAVRSITEFMNMHFFPVIFAGQLRFCGPNA